MTKDTVNAEEIDGYRGNDDLDRILEFIEAKPDEDKSSKNVKRNRKPDKKPKRSRTPSAAPSVTKETSAEPEKVLNNPEPEKVLNNPLPDKVPNNAEPEKVLNNPEPEKDSNNPETEICRAESSPPESVSIPVSAAAPKPQKPAKPPKPSSTQNLGTLISSYITSSSNQKLKQNSKQTSPTSPTTSSNHRSSETSKSRSTDRKSSDRKSSNPNDSSNQYKEIISKETSPSEQQSDQIQVVETRPNNSVPEMCFNDEEEDETNFETPSEVEELDDDEPVPKLEEAPPTEVGTPNSSFSVQELKAVHSQSQNQSQIQISRDQTHQPSFNYESILKFVKSGNLTYIFNPLIVHLVF